MPDLGPHLNHIYTTNGDWLDHTESHIAFQPGFDFLLPIHRDWDWGVDGHWAASGSTMSLSGGPCIMGSS